MSVFDIYWKEGLEVPKWLSVVMVEFREVSVESRLRHKLKLCIFFWHSFWDRGSTSLRNWIMGQHHSSLSYFSRSRVCLSFGPCRREIWLHTDWLSCLPCCVRSCLRSVYDIISFALSKYLFFFSGLFETEVILMQTDWATFACLGLGKTCNRKAWDAGLNFGKTKLSHPAISRWEKFWYMIPYHCVSFSYPFKSIQSPPRKKKTRTSQICLWICHRTRKMAPWR